VKKAAYLFLQKIAEEFKIVQMAKTVDADL
jgi:hypothetical protein